MGELLLELLSEEIPARMQRRAIEDLASLIRDKLAAAEIPAGELRSYVTPRRLVVIADGIAAVQPDRSEERRGPRVGAPPAAIDGFLRSAGLGSIEECEIRDTGRGQFYFAVVKRSGRPSAEVLPELIRAAIAELPWPKSMRWPGALLRWVRPLTSLVSLYDGDILPLALDGVPVGRTTRGHRFLAPDEISVADAADYLERLQQAYVIVDQDRRRELIRNDLDRRAAELGLAVKPDPGLLDEVTGLAEFPIVLAGRIDADFVRPLPEGLPPEVLQTAMRAHQKYFSCVYADGRPAPYFLFIANNLAADGGKAIIAGNERVLRARLADARFFWDQDRKVRLEDRVEALKDRVYHAKLGSVYDKVERVEALAEFLSRNARFRDDSSVTPAQAGGQGERPNPRTLVSRVRGNDRSELSRLARRAARLAKADLSTGMVGEFPELQGVMGRYYALHDGEPCEVADAIADQYKPLGPDDICPTAPNSIVVALADKIDTLVAFFAIDEKPTGSRDPFALRRAAQGVIRLILENDLRLRLAKAFAVARAAPGLPALGEQSEIAAAVSELLAFITDRLKVHLHDQGVRHDLIAAAFVQFGAGAIPYTGTYEDNLVRLRARVEALAGFLDADDGANLLIAYRRAVNLVRIEDRKDGSFRGSDVDASLLCQVEEISLAESLDKIAMRTGEFVRAEKFEEAMAELARLRRPVDEFFDKVTVNTDDPELRQNRLRLLSRIRATMNQVADFSLIEG
ncbi:MAG TPA: glycine--tRNA ligase subunit beta [Stellaceae bacterium]|nr:glycine--tRNA ligase subunit beta [Stellaceae bacterium]